MTVVGPRGAWCGAQLHIHWITDCSEQLCEEQSGVLFTYIFCCFCCARQHKGAVSLADFKAVNNRPRSKCASPVMHLNPGSYKYLRVSTRRDDGGTCRTPTVSNIYKDLNQQSDKNAMSIFIFKRSKMMTRLWLLTVLWSNSWHNESLHLLTLIPIAYRWIVSDRRRLIQPHRIRYVLPNDDANLAFIIALK